MRGVITVAGHSEISNPCFWSGTELPNKDVEHLAPNPESKVVPESIQGAQSSRIGERHSPTIDPARDRRNGSTLAVATPSHYPELFGPIGSKTFTEDDQR
jgi:hypothetical protein